MDWDPAAFLRQIENLAAAGPKAIILREKDLHPAEYKTLAEQVLKICDREGTLCILHSYPEIAVRLRCRAIHLPLPVLRSLSEQEKKQFSVLGASCHSVEEAREAENKGCTYITAGHVYDTDCKKGLPGRGLEFLNKVCRAVSIPVYALGGITPENYPEVIRTGAEGAAVMSSCMTCEDGVKFLQSFRYFAGFG